MDSESAAPRVVEFQRLIPDSVGIAMRAADPADLLGWVRERLLTYAPPDSPLHRDANLGRALAFAWTRAVWNGLAQLGLDTPGLSRGVLGRSGSNRGGSGRAGSSGSGPDRGGLGPGRLGRGGSRVSSSGARPRPMPEPAGTDPCPCGSGKRFQECCLPIPLMPPLTQAVLWPYVLANIPQAQRDELLSSSRIPRGALIEFAAHLLELRRSAEVIAALQPRLNAPERYYDEDTAILLHLICEAYGMAPDGARCKLELLRETTERAPPSPLRSEAGQRLATIYMDRGDSEGAWTAFRSAQQDNPQADELCVLEVELLVAGNRLDEAKQRARDWAAALSAQGVSEDDPRVEFLTRMSINPRDPVTYKVQGAGGPLRDWLMRVADRQPVRYRLVPTATPARFLLAAPPGLVKLQQLWHDVFPLAKPFASQDQPFDGEGVWEPSIETRWCEFLKLHPESFDSLDILDDLATAVGRHSQAQSPWVDALLLAPLLTRGAELVDVACRDAGEVVLPWTIEDNRPALRGLFRLLQQQVSNRNRFAAITTAEKLMRLNPSDDQGVGSVLENLSHS